MWNTVIRLRMSKTANLRVEGGATAVAAIPSSERNQAAARNLPRVSFHVTAPRRPHLPVCILSKVEEKKQKQNKRFVKKKRRNTLLGDRDDTDRGGDGILRRRRVAVGDVPERAAIAALGARRRGLRRAPRLGAHLVGAARRGRRGWSTGGRGGGEEGGGTDPDAVRADGPALAIHPRQGPAGSLEEVRISLDRSLTRFRCSILIGCLQSALIVSERGLTSRIYMRGGVVLDRLPLCLSCI
jgi:hypothetical protein